MIVCESKEKLEKREQKYILVDVKMINFNRKITVQNL